MGRRQRYDRLLAPKNYVQPLLINTRIGSLDFAGCIHVEDGNSKFYRRTASSETTGGVPLVAAGNVYLPVLGVAVATVLETFIA